MPNLFLTLAIGFTLLLGVLHIYILVLEMFLWTSPRGLKAFGQTAQQAKETQTLAKNMGLYNGFLAVGCFLGVLASPFLMFTTLGFILVAGLYGGATASPRIYFVQALPAFLTLIFWGLSLV